VTTPTIETVDAEGTFKAWATAYPGLTGTGGAISAGLHQLDARSPAKGAVAQYRVTARTPGDTWDQIRYSVQVRSVGGTGGALAQASLGARRLVEALSTLAGQPAVVQTALGEWVRIVTSADISGPTLTGVANGQVTYSVDATLCCQPIGPPYGTGLYGTGPYGG
jgi:hypothetical protein